MFRDLTGNSPGEIEFANSDTFHWTNCTPQHEAFNRSEPPAATYGHLKGLWGDFENYIQQSLGDVDHRACILAGPVLANDDPSDDFGNGPVQYPLLFWKVVCVTVSSGGRPQLKVFGFLLSQQPVVDRFGIERFGPGRFQRYQASLQHIGELAGVTFDDVLIAADTMAGEGAPRRPITRGEDIRGLAA